MRTFKETACVVVATAALGVAWPAQAGPNFVEGMCDGGVIQDDRRITLRGFLIRCRQGFAMFFYSSDKVNVGLRI